MEARRCSTKEEKKNSSSSLSSLFSLKNSFFDFLFVLRVLNNSSFLQKIFVKSQLSLLSLLSLS